MLAKEAKRLRAEALEPENLEEAFAQIRLAASIGFSATTILVPKTDHDWYTELTLTMLNNGFKTYRDDFNKQCYCVTIEWD